MKTLLLNEIVKIGEEIKFDYPHVIGNVISSIPLLDDYLYISTQTKINIELIPYKLNKELNNNPNIICGLDNTYYLIKELILYRLILPNLLDKYNINLPHGLLLYGPPGVGKTHLVYYN